MFMSAENWENVIKVARKTGEMLLATADERGVPHISVVNNFVFGAVDHVEVRGWFCENTCANLIQNPNVSLVVWDPQEDCGYQLVGEEAEMEDLAMLDGYAAGLEEIPQVERKIYINIHRILAFKKKAHMDLEVNVS